MSNKKRAEKKQRAAAILTVFKLVAAVRLGKKVIIK